MLSRITDLFESDGGPSVYYTEVQICLFDEPFTKLSTASRPTVP
jgi:hypothetical protein